MAQFIWNNYDQQTVVLYRLGRPPLELRSGDFIRSSMFPDGIKIVKFYGIVTEVGPRGFTYCPWNSTVHAWMGPPISVREDPRYILCEPAGISHPGIHMCADTIESGSLTI